MAYKMPDENTYKKIAEWLKTYRTTSDEKEKDIVKARIVSQMIPVVQLIARKIARRSYDPIEDMVQAGFIGLLKAIEKYSPEKNDNFRVYAGYFIIGEMKHFLRDKLHSIKVPAYIQELTIRINNFTKNLTPEELQALTSEEIASALDTSAESVDAAMQADRRKTVSLDDVFSEDRNYSFEEVIADGDYKIKADYADAKIIFNKIISKLPPEEKVLIDMYYMQDMSKREIANALMMTPMSVTRRMKQAFNIISSYVIEDSERNALLKGNMARDDISGEENFGQ